MMASPEVHRQPDLLAGIRVIDLTSVVFGPLATQILADYGAEVIKIEPPTGDTVRYTGRFRNRGMGAIFLNINRGKKSVVLDLKRPDARRVMLRLLAGADVFVHNVRREPVARLGLSAQDVLAVNPSILYCSATGFSDSSPLALEPAIDDVIQVASGLAALNADADGTPRFVPTLVADKTAAYGLSNAILAALVRRARTGRGGVVDVPMFDTMAAYLLVEHLQADLFVPSQGSAGYARVGAEGRRIYRAADGYLSLTPYSTAQWIAYFGATGRAHMTTDPRVTDPVQRSANIRDLYAMVADVAPQRTVDEWIALCREIKIPAYRVISVAEMARNPDLVRSGTIAQVDHPSEGRIKTLASPGFFDGLPARCAAPAPLLGEHTHAVLGELGLSDAQIAALGAPATGGAS